MQKIIILLTLISLTFQVDHCFLGRKFCKTCKDGYYLVNNQYCSKIDHCETFSDNVCSWCEYGYRLNSEKTSCEKIGDDHCQYYSNDEHTTCSSCQYGYKMKEDKTGCTLITEHCISSYDSTCNGCEKGYALNTELNTCVEFEKCSEVNSDGTKCTKCAYDFYQPDKDGKCTINYCEEYDDEGNCEECEKFFYLNEEGKCQYIPIPYCRKGNETHCEKYSGFLGKDGNVEEGVKNYNKMCQSEDADGICYRCEPGYTLDETTHECISNCEEFVETSPICKYCEHGYIPIEGDTVCYPVLKKDTEEEADEEKDKEKEDDEEKTKKEKEKEKEKESNENEGDGMQFIKLGFVLNLILVLLGL